MLKRVKPQDFRKVVETGKIPPVVFFVGEDDYLTGDLIDALKAKGLAGSDPLTAMESWDGKEHSAGDIVASAEQLSFGAMRKLLVVRNAEPLLSEEEILGPYMKNPLSSSVLVFCVEKLDGRRKLAKAIEDSCAIVTVGEQYEDQHNAEVQRLLKRFAGLKFAPDALECLRDWVGDDLAAMSRELEKISIVFPDKVSITIADIEGLVFRQGTQNVFELADSMAAEDRLKALDLMVRLMADGKSALELFGLLRSQGGKLYQAGDMLRAGQSSRDICQSLRVPAYFCDPFIAKAKKAKLVSPRRFFALLLEHDRAIKTGLWKESLSAELLVLKLCPTR